MHQTYELSHPSTWPWCSENYHGSWHLPLPNHLIFNPVIKSSEWTGESRIKNDSNTWSMNINSTDNTLQLRLKRLTIIASYSFLFLLIVSTIGLWWFSFWNHHSCSPCRLWWLHLSNWLHRQLEWWCDLWTSKIYLLPNWICCCESWNRYCQ
jgi:hypothetical protein